MKIKDPISIVIPVYNEENNLKLLNSEIIDSIGATFESFEIIYVDDGSTDDSFLILNDLARKHRQVKIVKFRRNFGQSAALNEGFKNASYQIIVAMDSDCQNDPKDIPKMYWEWKKHEGCVSGRRRNRKDKRFTRRIPSSVANKIIAKLSKLDIRDFGCTLKIYNSEYIKNLEVIGDMHRIIPFYLSSMGCPVTEIDINHRPRHSGTSKYGFSRVTKVFLDVLTVYFLSKFKSKPIHFFGNIGLFSILMGLLLAILSASLKFFQIKDLIETPLLTMSLFLFMIGFQFIFTGLMLEYIIRLNPQKNSTLLHSAKKP